MDRLIQAIVVVVAVPIVLIGYIVVIEGIVRLHEKIRGGVPPAYEIRGVAE